MKVLRQVVSAAATLKPRAQLENRLLSRAQTPEHKRQRFFIALGLIFLLFMLISLIFRSSQRNSVIAGGNVVHGADSALPAQEGSGPEIRLQDFHRVQVKDGKKIWEISATDAHYFPTEGVTHVNQASLMIYRPKGGSVHLKSDSAKLTFSGATLSRADLEGSIEVVLDENLKMTTEFASFEISSGVIHAPGAVEIDGPNYRLSGTGLSVKLNDQKIELEKNVNSIFKPGAKVPTNIGFLQEQKKR